MNRVGQQPPQRPPNLPQAPGMPYNRSGAPGYPAPPTYSNVQSRPAIPQNYPSMQPHRGQSIGPQPPNFSRQGSMGYFGGPTTILGPPIPSPNSALQSLQQNPVSIQQQPPSSANNGLPPHLTNASSLAGTNPSSSNASNTNASGSAVDESEFPPLSASSQQGGGAGSTSSSLAGGGNLHSSYASQAGTAIGSQPPSGLSTSNAPRDEDFPPLGAQLPTPSNPTPGHDGHSNGFTSQQQDQSQQHRANLIGTLHSGQSLLGQSLAAGGQPPSRPIPGFPSEADKRNFSKLNQNNHIPWSSQQQQQPPSATSSGFSNGTLNQQPPHLGPPPNLGFQNQQQTQSFTPGPPGQSTQTPGILQLPHQPPIQHGVSPDAALSNNGQPNSSSGAQQSNQPILPQTPAQQILLSAADRWGLLGLLAAIKGTDPDSQLLTIGSDLSAMGLDMNTPG
ncbi:hypothetical protein FRC02_009335 [Tulasnella sp. 418]|nr:hypothetical protein FRC02_009335 [Tulasnella sp. 418]